MSDGGDARDDDVDLDRIEELMDLVGRAFDEADPLPEPRASQMSYVRWGSPDADIAMMTEVEFVGVRHDDANDDVEVEFVGAAVRIEATLSPRRIVGDVEPWLDGDELSLEFDGGPVAVDVDTRGGFSIDSPRGPLRFRVGSARGQTVTEWFSVNPNRDS